MNPIKIKTLVTSQEEGAPTKYESRGVKKKKLTSLSPISYSHSWWFLILHSSSYLILSNFTLLLHNFSLRFMHNHNGSSTHFQLCWRGRVVLQGKLTHFCSISPHAICSYGAWLYGVGLWDLWIAFLCLGNWAFMCFMPLFFIQ